MLTATATGKPLVVTALHATTAYDYEYYRSPLADPAVLVDAVGICVFRAPLLAVPVGGARRGGYMSFDLLTLAMAAKALLDGRPGFPLPASALVSVPRHLPCGRVGRGTPRRRR
ncbi:DUF6302 family protein [Streptomyces sp. NPDC051917]|uniref:DUF6302 family protein n=1 Tax=Streptomyces sp. NPDC051917 TaxID=3154754 RepID=UPI0034539777